MAEDTEDTEDPINTTFLREEYLKYIYSKHAISPGTRCGGRACRAVARLQSESAAASPSDGLNNHDSPFTFTANKPEYRCMDCIGGFFYCEDCVVADHSATPLHRIEHWNGSYFKPAPLDHPQIHQLLYLGHDGARCDASPFNFPPSRPKESTLTVVHTNGYHKLHVSYCNCPSSPEPYVQLVLAGLFPATHARPATAFTFQLLKHYQQMNLASKTAAHDYHKCLLRLSDAIDSHRIPVCIATPTCWFRNADPILQSAYHQLVDVGRQWRVLETLFSFGKLDGKDISRGELALICPACPHPGINIPDGWEDDPNRYGSTISRLLSRSFRFVAGSSTASSYQVMGIFISSAGGIVLAQERIVLRHHYVEPQCSGTEPSGHLRKSTTST